MTAGGHGFDGVERRGLMFVLSSPSGAGKTTLSRMLVGGRRACRCRYRQRRGRSVPARSRASDYCFVDKSQIRTDGASGTNCSNGPPYSTTATARRARRSRRRLSAGQDVLFDIDWQGTQQLREKARADVVSVFILPPSAADLEKRLHTRAQDSDEVIRGRMNQASDEMSHWAEYDYIVINDNIDEAFAEVQSILRAERLKRERRTGLDDVRARVAAAIAEIAGRQVAAPLDSRASISAILPFGSSACAALAGYQVSALTRPLSGKPEAIGDRYPPNPRSRADRCAFAAAGPSHAAEPENRASDHTRRSPMRPS